MADSQEGCWFVLNHIPAPGSRREKPDEVVARYNAAAGADMHVFAPTFVEMSLTGAGAGVRREKPLLFHYVFVRGTEDDVKSLCRQPNGFSLVMNHAGPGRYLTVSEADMASFIIIARHYGNRLPCYATDEVSLEEGDLVEIVAGDFAGLRGRFRARKGARSGSVHIAVTNSFSAAVYDVRAEYVRVLEFARDSKRAYDQVEAFVPRLYAALREFHERGSCGLSAIAPVEVFCRRFSSVRCDSPKLDAKLQLLLAAANRLLGDVAAAGAAARRYGKLDSAVTNVWTRALGCLAEGVLDRDPERLRRGLALLGAPGPGESRSKTALRKEYDWYLGTGDDVVAPV